MNGLADPLAQLKGLHLPEAVSPWPPAPGWWLAGVSALLLLGAGLAWLRGWWRRRAPERAALRELRRLEGRFLQDGDARRLVEAASIWLRRVALVRFGRAAVAGCHGEAWLAFLDRTGGDGAFSAGVGRVLADGPYRQEVAVDGVALLALLATWLKRGRRGR